MGTLEVYVGGIGIGGDNPVRVQSMTDTLTRDVDKTVEQIIELWEAGSELVRFTVKDHKDAQATPRIRENLKKKGYAIPLIGDFHFNGHILLSRYPDCAKALDKFRINPGNVGTGNKRDVNFEKFIELAIQYGKPIRIGVNGGSLDQDLLSEFMEQDKGETAEHIFKRAVIASALYSAQRAEELGINDGETRIIISTKVSDVNQAVEIYSELSEKTNYPLHLGVTEAGPGVRGEYKSVAALSRLLSTGIGDTIRVSVTPEPGKPRTREVYICRDILQVNGLRKFSPDVIACPGCGRTSSTEFQILAFEIDEYIKQRTPAWKDSHQGFEGLTFAVMGCVVNGPGESRHAHVGISLPGDGEDPFCPLYVDGEMIVNLRGKGMKKELKQVIEWYVAGERAEQIKERFQINV